MPLNLVIPMAGRGSRFRTAGFTQPKPLVPICGQVMVKYVLDQFPESITRHLIVSRGAFNDDELRYFKQGLNCNVLSVDPHKLGPAYSLYLAGDQLPSDEGMFVSYCDIFWTWDFKRVADHLDRASVIYTHRGFHPHLVRNNFSAFCRPVNGSSDLVAEIREKKSFTDDWMNEPLSVGVFFARNSKDLLDAIEGDIKNDQKVSGEYFPSVAFNRLLSRGEKVVMQDVDFFIHWGVPEQLDDFLRWRAIHKEASLVVSQPNIWDNVMCMGGKGERMQRSPNLPKPFLPVRDQPMYEFVSSRFPARDTAFIASPLVGKTMQGLSNSKADVVLPTQTFSQLDTLRNASDFLGKQNQFFLTSCDAYGVFDVKTFKVRLAESDPDAVVFTFNPSLMQRKLAAHHSHVTVNGITVVDIHIKSKSQEDDLGLAGFFWVKDGTIFANLEGVADDHNELSADHAFKDFISQGYSILNFCIDYYVHLGTPEEYKEHGFWLEHFDKLNLK